MTEIITIPINNSKKIQHNLDTLYARVLALEQISLTDSAKIQRLPNLERKVDRCMAS